MNQSLKTIKFECPINRNIKITFYNGHDVTLYPNDIGEYFIKEIWKVEYIA